MDNASYSQVGTFLNCERQHYYRYGEKIQSTKPWYEPRAIGTVGHEALAEYYRTRQGGASHDEGVEAAVPVIWQAAAKLPLFDEQKIINTVSTILANYFRFYEHDNFRIIAVEIKHDVQFTDEFGMPVIMDLIKYVPGVGNVLVDHKFVYNFIDPSKADMDPQLPVYSAACIELDIAIAAREYNQLRYRFTKANLENPDEMFCREDIPMSPARVANTMRNHVMAANRIGQLKKLDLPTWRSKILMNTRDCAGCEFLQVCNADLEERDQQIIRQSFYEPRERRNG